MTDKELHQLRREDLLEMLIAQSQQMEELKAKLAEAEAALQERRILLEEAGSIANAALQLNRVFEAAQAASDQYLNSVRQLWEEREAESRQLLDQTRRQCVSMLLQAQRDAQAAQTGSTGQPAAAELPAPASQPETTETAMN